MKATVVWPTANKPVPGLPGTGLCFGSQTDYVVDMLSKS